MSFINSFKNLFRSAGDAAADAIADPIRDGKYAIEDAKKRVIEITQQQHEILSDTNSIQKELDAALAEVAKYEKFAVLAGQQKNEDDVKEALRFKNAAQKNVELYQHNLAQNKHEDDTLQDEIDHLEDQIKAADQNYKYLSSRLKTEQRRAERAKNQSKPFDTSALDGLANAVAKASSDADAWQTIETRKKPDTALEDKYSKVDESDEFKKYMK